MNNRKLWTPQKNFPIHDCGLATGWRPPHQRVAKLQYESDGWVNYLGWLIFSRPVWEFWWQNLEHWNSGDGTRTHFGHLSFYFLFFGGGRACLSWFAKRWLYIHVELINRALSFSWADSRGDTPFCFVGQNRDDSQFFFNLTKWTTLKKECQGKSRFHRQVSAWGGKPQLSPLKMSWNSTTCCVRWNENHAPEKPHYVWKLKNLPLSGIKYPLGIFV